MVSGSVTNLIVERFRQVKTIWQNGNAGMPLRVSFRSPAGMPVHLSPDPALQVQDLRPPPGPHRSPYRSPRGKIQGPDRTLRRRILGDRPGQGPGRPGAAKRTLPGQKCLLQCPDGPPIDQEILPPGCGGPSLIGAGHGISGLQRPGLPSHPQNRPHHCRFGRRTPYPLRPHFRSHPISESGSKGIVIPRFDSLSVPIISP